ncbi:MAG: hypothetical protein AAFO96_03620 [Bacteroidota bacterium]
MISNIHSRTLEHFRKKLAKHPKGRAFNIFEGESNGNINTLRELVMTLESRKQIELSTPIKKLIKELAYYFNCYEDSGSLQGDLSWSQVYQNIHRFYTRSEIAAINNVSRPRVSRYLQQRDFELYTVNPVLIHELTLKADKDYLRQIQVSEKTHVRMITDRLKRMKPPQKYNLEEFGKIAEARFRHTLQWSFYQGKAVELILVNNYNHIRMDKKPARSKKYVEITTAPFLSTQEKLKHYGYFLRVRLGTKSQHRTQSKYRIYEAFTLDDKYVDTFQSLKSAVDNLTTIKKFK